MASSSFDLEDRDLATVPTSLMGSNANPKGILAQKPRVARHELPWENMVGRAATPTGLWLRSRLADATPLGLCRTVSVIPGLLVPRNPGLEGAIPSGLGEIRCKDVGISKPRGGGSG